MIYGCRRKILAWIPAMFVAVAPIFAGAEERTTLAGKELLEFLGPVPSEAFQWTKQTMVDFELYNGKANPPLAGNVGFYVGGHPSFKPPSNSMETHGHLRRYDVKWYRSIAGDGTVRQTGLIRLDHYWHVDISISANCQLDVDRLIEAIGNLPLFANLPRPASADHPW